jgi:Zn-dependent M28 family amino/carboxypeptidase
VFVAFSGEERGLLGSKAFVDRLDGRGHQELVAMVNLDTLGLSATKFERREADPLLACLLTATANLTGDALTARDNGAADSSDHEPFHDAGIASIRLHSLTANSIHVIHSSRDRIAAIDQVAYYSSYRLIATYVAVIDQTVR